MENNTEIFVCAPGFFRFSKCVFPPGAAVRDVLERFVQQWGTSPEDFYVCASRPDDLLQAGAVYRLAPRLVGGKGGFGSMLRALGAQIEKTTNREACRDLSGRRLRDVNHEKEMGEWLKRQADREVEREERRIERLRKKAERPQHDASDPDYQRQCHSLAERLEDSVLKGLQAAAAASSAAKPGSSGREPPVKKRKMEAKCLWTGLDDLSDESDSESEEEPEAGIGRVPTGGEASVATPSSSKEFREVPSSRAESGGAMSGGAESGRSANLKDMEQL
ncbi:splicing regulator SDE2 [Stigmatopora nigra]